MVDRPLPPTSPYTLFEVSWEVCNKVGGIYTVIASKAKTIVGLLGDDYVTVGPWLLGEHAEPDGFEEESGHEEFATSCRDAGIPVRVGRWHIPGRPRAILVEFSGLLRDKDAYLARLWEHYRVDSLLGGWDYLEPVLFGRAAGMAIERWWQIEVAPRARPSVVHVHEWMAGTAMLEVRSSVPSIGTVFTTHATMLGRALAATGEEPLVALGGRTPERAARDIGVASKHSLEGVTTREADVFTTVSGVTAQEAEALHSRRATPILPNGIDIEVADRLASAAPRGEARAALVDLASRFLDVDVSEAVLIATSGRYEFRNKGFDVLLEAAARLEEAEGPKIVLFLFVPAGVSGPRLEMLTETGSARRDPSIVSTHHLFEPESDPIQRACERLGLRNGPEARVRVLHLPIYLSEHDGLLGMPYESVIRAVDLTCFPSFYEPWGLTPAESLALGVPTVTGDSSGFGRWMQHAGVDESDGLYLVERSGLESSVAIGRLTELLARFAASPREEGMAERCRAAASRLAWSELVPRYLEAYEVARDEASRRADPAADVARAVARPTTVSEAPTSPRPRLRRYEVAGSLPPALDGLHRLARNYRWTWDSETRDLFEQLSPRAWTASGHNPVRMLRDLPRTGVEIDAGDETYALRVADALERLDKELAEELDPACVDVGISLERPIAYFCLEFGIESSLRLYSGGLGVLAGDHLKTASDLRLPMIGLGLFYHRGYLHQQLTRNGDQHSLPERTDPDDHALEPLSDEQGHPVTVTLQFPGGPIQLRAWRADVGRVPLYLLDTNVAENRPDVRSICDQLYGGDSELRLQQEIVLGRGGVRLLRQLGLTPAVAHLNEGHAAFAPLERVARLVRDRGLTVDEARELVRASTVFTTHTPVAAGHDRFSEELVRRYFSDVESWLGLPWERFWALGTSADEPGVFSMTRLAVRLAEHVNGVSEVHARVSRSLLAESWPGLLPAEIPLRAVTNGVHVPTWMARSIRRACPARSVEEPPAEDRRERLWQARRGLRRRFLDSARQRLTEASSRRGQSAELTRRVLGGLEEGALLVGFARRFAPYKRADLLLREPRRLHDLLDHADRPVRLFFAGKAHPHDGHGQEILRRVAQAANGEFAGRIFFLENYDLALAELMVRGVDVWLNTPTRPLEASGTSGMKAAVNGTLHVSALDGWWSEGFEGDNGWAIRAGEHGETPEQVDDLDCDEILRLLEREIAPLFFERGESGRPERWLDRVERSITSVSWSFSAERMLTEYRDWGYLPAGRRQFELRADSFAGVREAVAKKRDLRRGFAEVRVLDVQMPEDAQLDLGDRIEAAVTLERGRLHPEDLRVELVFGASSLDGELVDPRFATMVPATTGHAAEDTHLRYTASIVPERAGRYACGIRISLGAPGPVDPALADLVLWA